MDTISIRPNTAPRTPDSYTDGSGLANLPEDQQRKAQRQQMFAQKLRGMSDSAGPAARMRTQNKARKITAQGKNRIDNVHFGMLLGVSLFFDLLAFIIGLVDYIIPELGSAMVDLLIVPPALFSLYMMYKSRGIDFGDSKVLMRFWGTAVTNFIPFLSFLPDFTVNVILTTMLTRAEDKLKRANSLATGGRVGGHE